MKLNIHLYFLDTPDLKHDVKESPMKHRSAIYIYIGAFDRSPFPERLTFLISLYIWAVEG